MAEPARQLMTLAEYLAWNPSGDSRWELYSGVPVAMAPASPQHSRIAGTLAGLLFAAVRGSGCGIDAELGVPSPSRANSHYHADLAVSCPDRGVVLIVEVLSPSTEDNDRKIKLHDYRRLPSVYEIVLLDRRRIYGEVYRRWQDGRWTVDALEGPQVGLTLNCVDLDVLLGDVYATVTFGDAAGQN